MAKKQMTVPEETLTPEPAAQINPHLLWSTSSGLARAVVFSVAAVACLGAASYGFGWEQDRLMGYVSLAVALPFGLVALGQAMPLLWPIFEPLIETLTRRDWNRSGAIGDAAEPLELTLEQFKQHKREMRDQIKKGIRTSARKDWLEPPFQWDDGSYCVRREYELIRAELEEDGDLTPHSKGHAGKVSG